MDATVSSTSSIRGWHGLLGDAPRRTRINESRSSMMLWISLIVFVLLAIVYVLADHLLRRIVAEPIEHTNHSLAQITDGDLQVLATETRSIEFSMLSAGINTTVDALKRLILGVMPRQTRTGGV